MNMNMKLKDMFKFVGDKKSKYPYVYFSNGTVYATSGRVCLMSKMDYPELYEGSTRDKKFEYVSDYTFPNCDNLLLDKEKSVKVKYSKGFFKRALDFYNEHKESIRKELFEVQLKIDDTRSVYIGVDIVKSICDYLNYFSNAELFISTNLLGKQLQFESYKESDTIFDDDNNKEVESYFVFITDKLNKENQTIYTYDDKLYIAEDSTYNLLYKGLIERSNLEDSGYIDIDYMNKYFKKYDLPDATEFRDNLLSVMENRDILNIIRFDDYLHRIYGDYDNKGKDSISMEDMFIKLFGDDAKIMASFFGVDKF